MKKQNISPLAEASTKFNYRLVDEYETKFGLRQQTSRRPFSMRELIVFLDFIKDCGADPTWHRFGFPLVYNEFNLDGSPNLEHLESLRDFMRIRSDFYPDVTLHYRRVVDDWLSVRKWELESSTVLGSEAAYPIK